MHTPKTFPKSTVKLFFEKQESSQLDFPISFLLCFFFFFLLVAVSIVTFESSDVTLMAREDELAGDSQMAPEFAVPRNSRQRKAAESVRSAAVWSAAWSNLQALCPAVTCFLLFVVEAIFESVSNYILCFLVAKNWIKIILVLDL